ncbi:MAG: hypothetical protein EOP92_07880 [Lysobacteraceae bacterium]|nr:MAG: hypothetical protein EOP92_07880 [Xanthomonadaceae bacterium]
MTTTNTLSPAPTSREQLWALLAEAAEIEHHLMCCYLYAAFSLKEGVDEDVSESELEAIQRWRNEITAVAIEEMSHLATVCNILSSLGAPAHLAHQNFPVAPGYHPAGVVVKLTPFNPQTLAHFIYLERPENAAIADGQGFEPARQYLRDNRMDRLMSVATNYETVGELYHTISRGLTELAAQMGEQRLFVGNPAHQLSADTGRLPDLKVVRCLKTAIEAIDTVVRQGEGADAGEARSHYQRFLAVQQEYESILQARPAFRPARMSAHNPVMRRPPTPEGKLWITLEPASSLLDLGNALYNHCLRCLSLAYAGVDADAQRTLVQTSIELMHLLGPIACRLGTLPANPELPEATAGVSFATLRSSAALSCDVTSLALLVERLDDMRERCDQLSTNYDTLQALLQPTRDGLERLSRRLSQVANPEKRLGTTSAAVTQAIAVVEAPPDAAIESASTTATVGPPVPEDLGGGFELIRGKDIDLVYSGTRCIHARHCVLGLPNVFKANVVGPWIEPDAATTEELVTVAHMCPSGAIQYRRHDGGAEEAAPPVNLVQLRENGPLGIRADIRLDGEAIGMRAVLCRCGASRRKPFCDGSHNDIHFKASGEPDTMESAALASRGGPLSIEPETNGPLAITGNLELCCGTGRTINRVTSTRLCRCGGSSNKPYCDNTHRTNGFRS